jgi:hypothetical protein
MGVKLALPVSSVICKLIDHPEPPQPSKVEIAHRNRPSRIRAISERASFVTRRHDKTPGTRAYRKLIAARAAWTRITDQNRVGPLASA